MNGFTLQLHGATTQTVVEHVTSFVGEDASGQFGIRSGHDRFASVLVYGLARFRVGNQAWRYLAMPGGILHFSADTLRIGTRFFIIGDDYHTLNDQLEQSLIDQELQTERLRENLARLEHAMLQRLWKMDRP